MDWEHVFKVHPGGVELGAARGAIAPPPHTHFFPEITGTQKENVDLKSLKCVL